MDFGESFGVFSLSGGWEGLEGGILWNLNSWVD